MMKQLLAGIGLVALFGTTAQAQCTDSLNISGQGPSCNQPGYACAYLWFDTTSTYQWNTGDTSSCIDIYNSGLYSVTVTASNGCTYTTSSFFSDSGLQVYDCSYICDPSPSNNYLEACVWSGTPNYTYLWSNGQTTPTIVAPAPGTYSVTVTDANGCTGTMTTVVPISSGSSLSATGNIIDATCGANGSIDITVTGAVGMAYFSWYDTNGNWLGSSEDLSGLSAGSYTVYIYDSSACSTQNSYSFTVGGMGLSYQVNNASCQLNNGAILGSATGFSGPVSYMWSNGATSSSITGLSSGMYILQVSDSNCTIVDTFYVYEDSCNMIIAGYVYNAAGAMGACNYWSSWPMPYQAVILQPIGQIVFTDMYGYYSFGVAAQGNYTVELYNMPAANTLLCPSVNSIAVNVTGNGYYDGNDFYEVGPNSHDLAIDVYPYTTATPGFPLWTNVSYCNYGNTPASGTFTYTYDAALTYDSYSSSWWGMGNASLNNHDAVNRVLTFDYTNLAPGSCDMVYVDFITIIGTPLGSTVSNCVHIDPTANDANLANNDNCDYLIVTGSWDPNSKHVAPFHTGDELAGGVILPTETQLEYVIHFQNLGNGDAVNIEVRDTLDADLMPNTIENIQTSHQCNVRIEGGNVLVFEFPNIYLPAESVDPEGSNGFISFKIQRQANLPIGTQIHNSAAIYFDFNAPVITNTTVSTIDILSTNKEIETKDMGVRVMPNPFRQSFTVQYELNNAGDVSIELFNTLGERVETLLPATQQAAGQHQQPFSVQNLASGVYFLNITTAQGVFTQRLVKE